MFGAAMICVTLANIHRDEKKKPQPFQISDFLPEERKPEVKAKPVPVEETELERQTRLKKLAETRRGQWRKAYNASKGKPGE